MFLKIRSTQCHVPNSNNIFFYVVGVDFLPEQVRSSGSTAEFLFDQVDPWILLKIMRDLGIPVYILGWNQSFLMDIAFASKQSSAK